MTRDDSGEKRKYVTPAGTFPSVTGILGMSTDESLREWREALGPEEVRAVMDRASRRGTAVHSAMESYLRGDLDGDYSFEERPARDSFEVLKTGVDDHVTKVYACEALMYSERLRVAGTSDVICEWDGVDAVLDFKNIGTDKEEGEVHSYFLQATAYSVMLEERLGRKHTRLVVLAAVSSSVLKCFVRERTEEMISEFVSLRDDYERVYGR